MTLKFPINMAAALGKLLLWTLTLLLTGLANARQIDTKAEREKVKEVLKSLLRTRENGEQTETAELTQGTSFLLNNSEVTNAANLQFEARPAEENCTKDTGHSVRLHNWTRGIFQVVGPGGIILYWLIDCHLNGKTVFDGPATRQHKDFIFDRLQNQFFILLLKHAPNI